MRNLKGYAISLGLLKKHLKIPSYKGLGVREFSFSSLGVHKQEKVVNRWINLLMNKSKGNKAAHNVADCGFKSAKLKNAMVRPFMKI